MTIPQVPRWIIPCTLASERLQSLQHFYKASTKPSCKVILHSTREWINPPHTPTMGLSHGQHTWPLSREHLRRTAKELHLPPGSSQRLGPQAVVIWTGSELQGANNFALVKCRQKGQPIIVCQLNEQPGARGSFFHALLGSRCLSPLTQVCQDCPSDRGWHTPAEQTSPRLSEGETQLSRNRTGGGGRNAPFPINPGAGTSALSAAQSFPPNTEH